MKHQNTKIISTHRHCPMRSEDTKKQPTRTLGQETLSNHSSPWCWQMREVGDLNHNNLFVCLQKHPDNKHENARHTWRRWIWFSLFRQLSWCGFTHGGGVPVLAGPIRSSSEYCEQVFEVPAVTVGFMFINQPVDRSQLRLPWCISPTATQLHSLSMMCRHGSSSSSINSGVCTFDMSLTAAAAVVVVLFLEGPEFTKKTSGIQNEEAAAPHPQWAYVQWTCDSTVPCGLSSSTLKVSRSSVPVWMFSRITSCFCRERIWWRRVRRFGFISGGRLGLGLKFFFYLLLSLHTLYCFIHLFEYISWVLLSSYNLYFSCSLVSDCFSV